MSEETFDDLPLFARSPEERSLLEKAFWRFHEAHPQVYTALCRYARQWKEQQVRRIGIATVFEVARYTLELHNRDQSGLKLNNNLKAYYARLIMDTEHDLKEIFQLRKQRKQATIGPKNDGLPPSDHINP